MIDKESKKYIVIREFIHLVLIIVFIVLPLRLFVAQPFFVSGASMSPTFEDKEYIIVDQITYRFNDPERGDVIVFHPPSNPNRFFIKRIIGLPGETVQLDGEKIIITKNDGNESITIEEPYITEENLQREPRKSFKLNGDEYFVMGDNRNESYDSRSWGPLEREEIIGRAFLRLMPPTRIGVNPGDYEEYNF